MIYQTFNIKNMELNKLTATNQSQQLGNYNFIFSFYHILQNMNYITFVQNVHEDIVLY